MPPSSSLSFSDPAQILSAAQTHDAGFDFQRVPTLLDEIAVIGLAAVAVVEPPGPLARFRGLHRDEHLRAGKRPFAPRRIEVVLVGPRLAGRRIEALLEADDRPAQRETARLHADRGAVLVEPEPD